MGWKVFEGLNRRLVGSYRRGNSRHGSRSSIASNQFCALVGLENISRKSGIHESRLWLCQWRVTQLLVPHTPNIPAPVSRVKVTRAANVSMQESIIMHCTTSLNKTRILVNWSVTALMARYIAERATIPKVAVFRPDSRAYAGPRRISSISCTPSDNPYIIMAPERVQTKKDHELWYHPSVNLCDSEHHFRRCWHRE